MLQIFSTKLRTHLVNHTYINDHHIKLCIYTYICTLYIYIYIYIYIVCVRVNHTHTHIMVIGDLAASPLL